jgi:hypothetical protein
MMGEMNIVNSLCFSMNYIRYSNLPAQVVNEIIHLIIHNIEAILVHESNKTIISPNIPKEVRNCVSNKLI